MKNRTHFTVTNVCWYCLFFTLLNGTRSVSTWNQLMRYVINWKRACTTFAVSIQTVSIGWNKCLSICRGPSNQILVHSFFLINRVINVCWVCVFYVFRSRHTHAIAFFRSKLFKHWAYNWDFLEFNTGTLAAWYIWRFVQGIISLILLRCTWKNDWTIVNTNYISLIIIQLSPFNVCE